MAARTSPGPAGLCPCGLGEAYGSCCGRFHRGEGAAATAELLMRSRFSAFAVADVAYLTRTWHRSTRPARIDLDPAQVWSRLDILGTTRGGLFDTVNARKGTLHERSAFVREQGGWFYLRALEPTTHP
jgi:SEC-C motif-containing protein